MQKVGAVIVSLDQPHERIDLEDPRVLEAPARIRQLELALVSSERLT